VLHSNRDGGYHGTKAHSRPLDGHVVNGTRRLEQRVAVHRFSGSSGSMDQPPRFANWLCTCSRRSVAGVWAIDGLSRKAFERRGSGVFPVVPCWSYGFLLERTTHPTRVRSGSTSRAAGARFYIAGQHRAVRVAEAVVLGFSGERATQSSSTRFLSRILVTLLQPRVTRHRKSSTGI
jgi:hypothetical protein